MKKIAKIIFSLLIVSGIFLNSFSIKAIDEGFVIDEYKVEILVRKDGLFVIDEWITVDFLQNRHGIYRDIPTRYDMTWNENGKEINKTYNFPISDVKVNRTYQVTKYPDAIRIRIGDADSYVFGIVPYHISYKIRSYDLELENLEIFYFNVIGTQWDTYINKVEFTIRFEDEVSAEEFYVYSGLYGNSELADNVEWSLSLDKTIITGKTTRALEPRTGITVLQNLPKDYFVYPNYNYLYVISGLLSIGILAFALFIYFSTGKDRKPVVTIEFSPPKGVDSAGVGYIIDNTVNTRDIISLILEWAKDGFITIEESVKKELTFTKNKELEGKRPNYERTLYNGLFRTGDVVEEKDLKGKLYKDIELTRQNILYHFQKSENKLYTSASISLKYLLMFIIWIPLALVSNVSSIVSTFIFRVNWFYILVPILITIVYCIISIYLANNWKVSKIGPLAVIGMSIIGLLISLVYAISAYSMGGLTAVTWTVIALVITAILIIIFGRMGRHTESALRLYGQTLGLFDFIKTAEEARLRLLVDENPSIFYDILPYAYAFNLVSVWTKAFKNITLPEQNFYQSAGDFDNMVMMNRLNRSMMHVQNQVATPPAPPRGSVGGGSFSGGGGGGGFSGGGFSGGGFGGGGGGSW